MGRPQGQATWKSGLYYSVQSSLSIKLDDVECASSDWDQCTFKNKEHNCGHSRQRHYSLTDASGCLRQISMTETLNETDVSRLIPVVRHNLNNKHILTVKQFDRNTLHQIFTVAHQFKRKLQTEIHTLATGCVLGTMFFEPSTRTHLSFTSAMQRLGGTVITLSPSESSLLKGESVEDTVRNIQGYCDIMVMRHPPPGQVTTAARHLHKP
ncbi:multifunctional protein pyr1-3-like [Bolinopsis microptera]|uniref:multifunctional protein pyr1-3-like n=1 Tax=Bolinopsis microptera TaxID=2820187 RepID=UPI003079E470